MKYLLPLLSACLITVAVSRDAHAFGTMSHMNMTTDAMLDEGFSPEAIDAVNVFNFYVDLFEKGNSNGATRYIVSGLGEDFDILIDQADALHFDGTSHLTDAAALEREWDRLARATRAALLYRLQTNDTYGALAVIGASLHAVQDFYSHTNWVEPNGDDGEGAASGPGWRQRGLYGRYPTWFDIPSAARLSADIYGPGAPHRGHGDWNADGNVGLVTGMNKDMSARPYYRDAYITAEIATYQWLRALDQWGSSFSSSRWNAVMHYDQKSLALVVNQVAITASTTQGWDGCTPTASDTYFAADNLIKLIPTDSVETFRRAVWDLSSVAPPTTPAPVASSDDIQRQVDFVRVRMLDYDTFDGADLFGEGSYLAGMIVGGQYMHSYIYRDTNKTSFTATCGPFTFMTTSPRSSSRLDYMLQLWDVDQRSHDDQMDLAPELPNVPGSERTYKGFYDKRTGSIGGYTGGVNGILHVLGSGASNPAEVTVGFDTVSLNPPVGTFTAIVSSIN